VVSTGRNGNANCGHNERVGLLVGVRWLEACVLSCVGPGANVGKPTRHFAAWTASDAGGFQRQRIHRTARVHTCPSSWAKSIACRVVNEEVRLTLGGGGVTGSCSSLRIHILLVRIHTLVAFCYSLLSPVLPARGENQRHWVRRVDAAPGA